MGKFKRRDEGVKATRQPVAITTARGTRVRAGDWLVIEGDQELALSDAEFRQLYEPDQPSDGALVRHGDRSHAPAAPAKGPRTRPGGYAPAVRTIPGNRGSGGNEIVNLGPGLGNFAKNSLDKNAVLPAFKIVDTDTGMTVYEKRDATVVEGAKEPQITSYKVDQQGNVTGMTVKPDDWPPRGEKF